jgi:tripartite-type tricarboxylate transporter receptor subunit TctC
MPTSVTRALSAAVLSAAFVTPALIASASAQSAKEFYPGKKMEVVVYSTAGSTYDLYARVLARHMPRYLPGEPTMIVKNMVGAGGLTATRYLYSQAPRDGTTIGTISRGIPFEPLLGGSATVEFDPLKFLWLGSMSRESTLAISWHTSDVKTAQDLLTKELLVAGTGAGADSQIIPNALNGLLDTKFKIIPGYASLTTATLAMERGEVAGFAYWSWGAIKSSKPSWVPDKQINLLFQTGNHPDIPDVPNVRVLAKSDSDRQAIDLLFARDVMARPFLATPEIPADRAKALQDAFVAAMKDPQLLKEAQQAQMEIELVDGKEVEGLIKTAFAAPKAVIERVREAMNRQ